MSLDKQKVIEILDSPEFLSGSSPIVVNGVDLSIITSSDRYDCILDKSNYRHIVTILNGYSRDTSRPLLLEDKERLIKEFKEYLNYEEDIKRGREDGN